MRTIASQFVSSPPERMIDSNKKNEALGMTFSRRSDLRPRQSAQSEECLSSDCGNDKLRAVSIL